MCSKKDWFQSLDEFDGGKVLLINDYECKVRGIETAKLMLSDGTIKLSPK